MVLARGIREPLVLGILIFVVLNLKKMCPWGWFLLNSLRVHRERWGVHLAPSREFAIHTDKCFLVEMIASELSFPFRLPQGVVRMSCMIYFFIFQGIRDWLTLIVREACGVHDATRFISIRDWVVLALVDLARVFPIASCSILGKLFDPP